MISLDKQTCTACKAGAPMASTEEISAYLPQLPGWHIIELDGVKCLQKSYRFKDFAQAQHFANRVGALAEQENHHPSVLIEWGKTTVTWWTHCIGGLHLNDFVMAAKTENIC